MDGRHAGVQGPVTEDRYVSIDLDRQAEGKEGTDDPCVHRTMLKLELSTNLIGMGSGCWTPAAYVRAAWGGGGSVTGTVTETFVCEAMVGKETTFKPIITTAVKVRAHFSLLRPPGSLILALDNR